MPLSQTGSYTNQIRRIKYDADDLDMVLQVITYRCQRPKRGLT
ncbi:hypothetical protein F383_10031 [Gossypium arboreum]|uniref:Uncharacterized protein n=1 Tax=Gossypium arboreum TaxID=29729 RepID=A0A0B0NTI2_GOSAR|nr:hypothetical protein F383_20731 [Gossypium arboreum]KHG28120.1 hypothetical protein F383_10031 [Gossypium arboreum]